MGTDASFRLRRSLLVAATLCVLALSLAKLQFAIVFLPLGVIVARQFLAGDRRLFAVLAAVVASLLSVVFVTMTNENRVEFDDEFRISRGAHDSYWGTYWLVFSLYSENLTNPALADLFNEGKAFKEIRDVEASSDSYPE